MIARREELKFKHQSAVVDAIETVTHDTETCQSGHALAGLPLSADDIIEYTEANAEQIRNAGA
jgi:hypothetical protein